MNNLTLFHFVFKKNGCKDLIDQNPYYSAFSVLQNVK